MDMFKLGSSIFSFHSFWLLVCFKFCGHSIAFFLLCLIYLFA